MCLSRKIDWEKIFDCYCKLLSFEYIESNAYNDDPPFGKIKVSKDEFIIDVKKHFLRNASQQNTNIAFLVLRKKLPVLAEYLILHCYENHLLNRREFAKIFLNIYTKERKDCTLFTEDKYDKLLEIFRDFRKDFSINKKDKKHIKMLSKEFNIYRGTAGRTFDVSKRGISWSLDRNTAEEFAKANMDFYKTSFSLILEGTISKKDIIVFLNHLPSGRFENEIIVNPYDIMNTKVIDTYKNEQS